MATAKTNDIKERIDATINEIELGKVTPAKGWNMILSLKEDYVKNFASEKNGEQSWHTYIGNKFQAVIHSIIHLFLNDLKKKDPIYNNLEVLTEPEIRKNEIVMRKLSVHYDRYLLLPDTDMAIVNWVFGDWKSTDILAIVSCKTSLRERIAQACYWKLKLKESDVTKGINVFLATCDNDNDFIISAKRSKLFEGRSRDRVIAEYELDGVYILREDFEDDWESDKVKRYERMFNDLAKIFRKTSQ
jgi:type II restriction enzyme